MPIFSGVVRQQTLNVVLHQRIQPADKGGNHTCDKQRDTHHSGGWPPVRVIVRTPNRPTFITTVENSAAAGAEAFACACGTSRAEG